MLNSNSFHNLIDWHTRITPVSQTTIDHVYSNVFKYKSVPGIVKCALTDHYPIFVILKHSKRNVDQTNHYNRSLKEFNSDNFNSTLKHRWINCYMTRPIWTKQLSINSSPLLFRSLN